MKRFLVVSICILTFLSNAVLRQKSAKPIKEMRSIYVYNDVSSSTNNYLTRALISEPGLENMVHPLNEACKTNVYSGNSCIEATIKVKESSWGGWLFLRGYKLPGEKELKPEFGDNPGCGLDLSGVEFLVFAAKGKTGAEKIEFFVGGLGWDPYTHQPDKPYPDSTQKVSTGVIQLTNEYQEYKIPLGGHDLSYVGCGFGFVVSGDYNSGDVVFYMDEIRYEAKQKMLDLPAEIWVAIIMAGGTVIGGIMALISTVRSSIRAKKEKEETDAERPNEEKPRTRRKRQRN